MASFSVTDKIFGVGVLNPNLRVFDIVMKTEYGTSYNAYLVKAQKTALIETCHARFFEVFLNNIQERTDLEKLDYIILNHCEPDHSGSLARLLKLAPNAQVIASQAGAIYLKNITNLPGLSVRTVRNGDSLDLGGVTLSFINAPFLHWPDSMFTWAKEEHVLFSCDFLGAHFCEPQGFDTDIVYPNAYKSAFLAYYDAIFSPFAPHVRSGLEKIKNLDIEYLCTSHGPILTPNGFLDYAKNQYFAWSAFGPNPVKTIPVFYTSAYGNTKLIAEQIAAGIKSVLKDADVSLYDLIEHDMRDMQKALNASDAFALGSPTINRDAVPPVWELLAGADAISTPKKPALAFGSYGWSGEAVANIMGRMAGLKLAVFSSGFRVCFVPTEEDLTNAFALGADFARAL